LATPAALKDAQGSKELSRSLRRFIRMYRPHESREDTVLFPAIRSLMTPKQYEDLGDQFEDSESDEHDHGSSHGAATTAAKALPRLASSRSAFNEELSRGKVSERA
jgi:hemerythrin-like domain-containing protein